MTAKSKARELLAGVLRIPVDKLPENPTPDSVEDWDSLAHGEILMALEDLVGRELDAAEIAAISGLGDIEAILEKAGVV